MTFPAMLRSHLAQAIILAALLFAQASCQTSAPTAEATPAATPQKDVTAQTSVPSPSSVDNKNNSALAPKVDPQLKLETALQDVLAALESHDFIRMVTSYTPPKFRASPGAKADILEQVKDWESMMQIPEAREDLALMVTTLRSPANGVIHYNASGDVAVIKTPPGSKRYFSITFARVDGRWYVKGF